VPTVLRWNGYRFYFFSNEGTEPPHIHVDRAECTAKFWLGEVNLARNIGFSGRQIAELTEKITAEHAAFVEAWNGYFGA